MKTEYTLWALPPGETRAWMEVLLSVRFSQHALKAVQNKAESDGWTNFRVGVVDYEAPDFITAIG